MVSKKQRFSKYRETDEDKRRVSR